MSVLILLALARALTSVALVSVRHDLSVLVQINYSCLYFFLYPFGDIPTFRFMIVLFIVVLCYIYFTKLKLLELIYSCKYL